MHAFPLLFTVGHKPYLGGVENDFGNEVPTWGPAVDVKVMGWGAPDTTEPGPNNSVDGSGSQARQMIDVVLYVAPGFQSSGLDRFVLDGVLYEAFGDVRQYDHNPFGWNPGGVVNLRRVEG